MNRGEDNMWNDEQKILRSSTKGKTCHKDKGRKKWGTKLMMGVSSKHDVDLTKT
jgi:hypothetical protein